MADINSVGSDENAILQKARGLIQQKKYDDARKVLIAIPNNPTARKWLEKLDEIDDPFASTRSPATVQLQKKPEGDLTESKRLLENVAQVFINHNWDVVFQTDASVQLEKKKVPNSWTSAIIIVLAGFLGSIIVMLAIATAKAEKVAVSAQADGVFLSAKGKKLRITSENQASPIASSIKDGASYATALLGGVAMTILYLIIVG